MGEPAKVRTNADRARDSRERRRNGLRLVSLWIPDGLLNAMWADSLLDAEHLPEHSEHEPEALAGKLLELLAAMVTADSYPDAEKAMARAIAGKPYDSPGARNGVPQVEMLCHAHD